MPVSISARVAPHREQDCDLSRTRSVSSEQGRGSDGASERGRRSAGWRANAEEEACGRPANLGKQIRRCGAQTEPSRGPAAGFTARVFAYSLQISVEQPLQPHPLLDFSFMQNLSIWFSLISPLAYKSPNQSLTACKALTPHTLSLNYVILRRLPGGQKSYTETLGKKARQTARLSQQE